MMNTLPNIILRLLSRQWPFRDVQYCEPGGAMLPEDTPVALHYARIRKAVRTYVFAFDEIRTLVDDGVITALTDDGHTIDIDAHEHMALTFFLGEVQCAWSRYRKRVARLRERRTEGLRERYRDESKNDKAQIASLNRNSSRFEK